MKLLFLLGCIPLRLLLTYIAKTSPSLPLALLYMVIGMSMLAIYFFDLRLTGAEAGGRIWWNNIRPVHALIYLTFAYMVMNGYTENAWWLLLADTIFGLVATSIHRLK